MSDEHVRRSVAESSNMERGEAPATDGEKTIAFTEDRNVVDDAGKPSLGRGLLRRLTSQSTSQQQGGRLHGLVASHLAYRAKQREKWSELVDVLKYLENKEASKYQIIEDGDENVEGGHDDAPSVHSGADSQKDQDTNDQRQDQNSDSSFGDKKPSDEDPANHGNPLKLVKTLEKRVTDLSAMSGARLATLDLPGYPDLAHFMGSDSRWMMCRKFGALSARLVLEKQDELREAEEELQRYDAKDHRKPELNDGTGLERLFTRRRLDKAEQDARREAIQEATNKFKEYADLVSAVRSLTCCEKPAPYEHEAVKEYIQETKPTGPSEMAWIYSVPDLITLRGAKERAKLSAIIEEGVDKVIHSPLLNGGQLREKLKEKVKNTSNDKLADYTIMLFLNLFVPAMFVVPIWLLTVIGNHVGQSIAVLVSFTLFFTFVLTKGTPAKPQEVLSGSAAYLAVLVVFYGGVKRDSSS